MDSFFDARGRTVRLRNQLGSGAEGVVWEVQGATRGCVKILNPDKRSPAKLAKLRAMVKNPPGGLGRKCTVWPKTLIFQDPGLTQIVGYAMLRLDTSRYKSLDSVWQEPSPHGRVFSWGERLQLAILLCRIVEDIHVAGHAIGDLQRMNVLVSDRCELFLVDCDSFEIAEPNGTIHMSEVGSEGYTSHEVLMQIDAQVPFSQIRRHYNDLFALAVLIFELLMGGDHPMTCRGPGVRASHRGRDAKVKAGLYAHAGYDGILPRAGAQPLATIPEALQGAFRRSFIDGYGDPGERPSAAEWRGYLSQVRLSQCAQSATHSYASTLPACPWCHWERKRAQMRQRSQMHRAVMEAANTPEQLKPAEKSSSSGMFTDSERVGAVVFLMLGLFVLVIGFLTCH